MALENSDKIALAALLLTIPGYVLYVSESIQGSDVVSLATPIVDFRSISKTDKSPTVAIAAVTLYNSGDERFNEVLYKHYLKFNFQEKEVVLTGYYEVNLNHTERNWIPAKNPVLPFNLKGEGSYSKQLAFYPVDLICDINDKCTLTNNKVAWGEFKSYLAEKMPKILIQIESHDLSGGVHVSRCSFSVDSEDAEKLLVKSKMRAQFNCWPEKA
ncbi:hypothetical protein L1D14_26515 [Vibrio tubiashii]|uniref:hypothetical protein n=1 Tax=Vibrio tubiashii TaxID=29498 RepID=UPI001EFE806D|nr:hypothetical protein [Vibrio tubiashii]MCG9579761.1 hypothetical protein [Vibrio tubiashii]